MKGATTSALLEDSRAMMARIAPTSTMMAQYSGVSRSPPAPLILLVIGFTMMHWVKEERAPARV